MQRLQQFLSVGEGGGLYFVFSHSLRPCIFFVFGLFPFPFVPNANYKQKEKRLKTATVFRQQLLQKVFMYLFTDYNVQGAAAP